MIKVLIIDDNLLFARKLMNHMNETNHEIKVCYIAINGKEAVEILNHRDDIDIFLLDLNIPGYNGIEVLERIEESRKSKYKNSCIAISGDISLMTKLRKNSMVYNVISKGCEFSKIMKEINNLINEKKQIDKEKLIKTKILEELLYIGYNISHKGTTYLIDAIFYVTTNLESDIDNLKKDIYPKIAIKYNQSSNNIKCDIIRATENMYCKCDKNRIKEYFAYWQEMKPNVKTVIYTVANKIAMKIS